MKGRVQSCANHNGQHIEQFCNLLVHVHFPWFDFLFEQPAFQLVVTEVNIFQKFTFWPAERAINSHTYCVHVNYLMGMCFRPQSEIERLYYSKLLSGS